MTDRRFCTRCAPYGIVIEVVRWKGLRVAYIPNSTIESHYKGGLNLRNDNWGNFLTDVFIAWRCFLCFRQLYCLVPTAIKLCQQNALLYSLASLFHFCNHLLPISNIRLWQWRKKIMWHDLKVYECVRWRHTWCNNIFSYFSLGKLYGKESKWNEIKYYS